MTDFFFFFFFTGDNDPYRRYLSRIRNVYRLSSIAVDVSNEPRGERKMERGGPYRKSCSQKTERRRDLLTRSSSARGLERRVCKHERDATRLLFHSRFFDACFSIVSDLQRRVTYCYGFKNVIERLYFIILRNFYLTQGAKLALGSSRLM